jgi:rhamnosyltransferase
VSIIVPVLNAERHLPGLLAAIDIQRPSPDEIILVDSGSTDDTCAIAGRHPRARVVTVHEFSHGRARNLGVRAARGNLVVFLSQDARPSNAQWLSSLLEPFVNPRVAATYSRQIPKDDATPMECFFLQHRFPDGQPLRRSMTNDWVPSLESVFFSNVSSAARREVVLRHPFDEELIMSEDQKFSYDVIMAGHTVVYQPSSVVVHSHRYSLAQAFRRYFDSVYSLARIFPSHSVGVSVSMGGTYIGRELRHMIKRHPEWLPYYVAYTTTKILATLAAHAAPVLPRWLLRRISLHAYYWK